MFSTTKNDCVLLSLRITDCTSIQLEDDEDSIRTVFSNEEGSLHGEGVQRHLSIMSHSNFLDRRRHTLPEVFSGGSKRIYWV